MPLKNCQTSTEPDESLHAGGRVGLAVGPRLAANKPVLEEKGEGGLGPKKLCTKNSPDPCSPFVNFIFFQL